MVLRLIKKLEIRGLRNVTDADGVTALQRAVKYRHYNIVRLLIDGGVDINARDREGKTALHYAAEYGGWS